MNDIVFRPWPKIARLNRDIVITEKLDGTNAAIGITADGPCCEEREVYHDGSYAFGHEYRETGGGQVYAQSRTRIITPQADNFGFAAWVEENKVALRAALGPGLHFGEWWGRGIQRGYGIEDRRFSLFNVAKWGGDYAVTESGLLDVVPVLYRGSFTDPDYSDPVNPWEGAIETLRWKGSMAVPGYKNPEGIVIFHTASSTMYKVTLEGDEAPKGVNG